MLRRVEDTKHWKMKKNSAVKEGVEKHKSRYISRRKVIKRKNWWKERDVTDSEKTRGRRGRNLSRNTFSNNLENTKSTYIQTPHAHTGPFTHENQANKSNCLVSVRRGFFLLPVIKVHVSGFAPVNLELRTFQEELNLAGEMCLRLKSKEGEKWKTNGWGDWYPTSVIRCGRCLLAQYLFEYCALKTLPRQTFLSIQGGGQSGTGMGVRLLCIEHHWSKIYL